MEKQGINSSCGPLLVGVSGASGIPLAVVLLRALSGAGVEINLVVSRSARQVIREESDWTLENLYAFAHAVFEPEDVGAPVASGSRPGRGMIVCPCSMSTLGHIASGCGTNLIHRAADVTLKERRPLVLVARETPLSAIHLQNMLDLTRAGAVIFPPCPAFYNKPESVEDLLSNMAGRILDMFGIPHDLCRRWKDGREGALI